MTDHPLHSLLTDSEQRGMRSAAIVGRAGSGKTATAKGSIEMLLAEGQRVCIIDPTSAWWGLRLRADGKHASGLEVVIFGGAHGDVAIGEHTGDRLAEAIGNDELHQVILDLSDFSKSKRTRFLTDFFETLFQINKTTMYLVLDEADSMAPQNAMPDTKRLKGAVDDIMRRGRIKGFRPILITQRPQVLDKSALAQVEIMVAMQLTLQHDRQAVKDWLSGRVDTLTAAAIYNQLPGLSVGQAVLADHTGVRTVQFPMPTTFDSSRAPEAGEGALVTVPLASINLHQLRLAFASVDESDSGNQSVAKTDRIRPDPMSVKRLPTDKTSERNRRLPRPEPAMTAAQFEAEIARRVGSAVTTINQQLRPILDGLTMARQTFIAETDRLIADLSRITGITPNPITDTAPLPRPPAPERAVKQKRVNGARTQQPAGDGKLPKGEVAILSAALQFGMISREHLSLVTGYKRSSRDAYIQRLKERGLLAIMDDGKLTPTTDGIRALPTFSPLPVGHALLEHWRQQLPEGERVILDTVVAVHPLTLARTDLDDTGYKRSSRDAYIQRLKTRQLISITGGRLVASPLLFE